MSASPCGTCPYRRSTPVGIWHPVEYAKLREQDAAPMGGRIFGCHANDGSICRGWAADQKRRGVPAITYRIKLITDDAAVDLFNAIDENDPDLYASIGEMVAANRGRRFPTHERKACKLAERKESK